MDKQARLETLRDLIVSLDTKVVIGRAIGSDELKRPLSDLRAERDALAAELNADWNDNAEAESVAHQQAKRDAKREAARKLVDTHTPEKLAELRAAARKRMLDAKLEYEHLSAAVQFVDLGLKFQAVLDGATPEEREAFEALLQKESK